MLISLVTAIAAVAVAPAPPPPPRPPVAVGDIASCSTTADEATANVVARIPGTLATLGDTVYELGTPDEFARCYDPAWGRFKPRTRPALGNHEYGTAGAAGYFGYFGARAGPTRSGYY